MNESTSYLNSLALPTTSNNDFDRSVGEHVSCSPDYFYSTSRRLNSTEIFMNVLTDTSAFFQWDRSINSKNVDNKDVDVMTIGKPRKELLKSEESFVVNEKKRSCTTVSFLVMAFNFLLSLKY